MLGYFITPTFNGKHYAFFLPCKDKFKNIYKQKIKGDINDSWY
jgi:hypothetical protein